MNSTKHCGEMRSRHEPKITDERREQDRKSTTVEVSEFFFFLSLDVSPSGLLQENTVPFEVIVLGLVWHTSLKGCGSYP